MTTQHYCKTCNTETTHRHMHEAAHGIAGTHMAGTEHFICARCNRTTLPQDEDAASFPFVMDRPAPIPFNRFLIGANLAGDIVILRPPIAQAAIPKADALMLAAWIVMLADDEDGFQQALEALRKS